MKRLLRIAVVLLLLSAFPIAVHGWILYLDGSTSPDAPWQFFQEGGADGGTALVDFLDPETGTMNHAIRIDSGANSTEWFVGPLFVDDVVASARFKTVVSSGGDSENILCATAGGMADHSAAPSITIVTNHYKLWSYTEGAFGSGSGGSQMLDLGPVVIDQLHTAYLYAHKSGLTRLWWDGHLVFDGVAPAVAGSDGYMEWGTGSWQYLATTTVDFDWIAYGNIDDVPPQSLFIAAEPGAVVVSWSTNNIGFTLQASPSLSSPSWVDLTNNIAIVGSFNTLTNTATGPAQFYRLHK